MHEASDIRQTPQHLVGAFRHFCRLIEGELHLAKAEMSHNLSRAGTGLIFFGIAAVMALVALNVLASALVTFVASQGLPVPFAAVLIGGAFLLGAVALAVMGKARLRADALSPEATIHNIQRDVQAVKEASHV